MLLGAVFEREIRFAPRARGLFVARAVYAAALLAIIATCWLVVTGTQSVTTAGDTARFGATLLRILAPLQLSLATLAAALTGAVAVTVEKDRRTLELLLVSRLSDRELVLGKLAASLVRVMLLLLAAVPAQTTSARASADPACRSPKSPERVAVNGDLMRHRPPCERHQQRPGHPPHCPAPAPR
jgi:hypothetical protein